MSPAGQIGQCGRISHGSDGGLTSGLTIRTPANLKTWGVPREVGEDLTWSNRLKLVSHRAVRRSASDHSGKGLNGSARRCYFRRATKFPVLAASPARIKFGNVANRQNN